MSCPPRCCNLSTRPSPRLGLALLGLAACSAGGKDGSSPIGGSVLPDLVAARARVDQPFQFSELALRDGRNLGRSRVDDRTGTERSPRLHPDGNQLVFVRERTSGQASSRELFVATLDGAIGERRLTVDSTRDDEPCWSPDGSEILCTSDRDGATSLWRMAADGSAPTRLFVPLPGGSDREADWHRGSGRIVWSRADASGRHVLWVADAGGTNAMPLTDGGATTGAGSGDRMPSWSADGTQVVFVRRISDQIASLALCDVASSAVSIRLQPNGDLSSPRFAPAGDRLLFGLAEPAVGRSTLRLAYAGITAGNPVLLWPDERWRLDGFDLLANLAALPTAAPAVVLDVTRAQVQIAAASSASGSRSQLVSADGEEYVLTTTASGGREIAGVNVRFDLPVVAATDVLELRVRSVARSSRGGAGSRLRMSIYNPVDERFDTVVEQPIVVAGAAQTMTFTTASLRHVTSERQLRVTVIADLDDGAQAELRIDQVEVVLVARAGS